MSELHADMMTVATSRKEREACPESYFGTLITGETFFFRYRFGVVRLGFGADEDLACCDAFVRRSMHVGGPLDGFFPSELTRNAIFAEMLDWAVKGLGGPRVGNIVRPAADVTGYEQETLPI